MPQSHLPMFPAPSGHLDEGGTVALMSASEIRDNVPDRHDGPITTADPGFR